jgi:pimeloyl-ACP methyl ester carboxylesterase
MRWAGRIVAARVAASAVLLFAGCAAVQAQSASLVSLDTPRGTKQAFILIRPSAPPVAWAVLFAGGDGALGLKSASSMAWGAGNFLVRTRMMFAGRGLAVAVVDAPSDHQDGMNGVFRMGRAHAGDIETIAAYLKKDADVPVWLIGTSMGTFSAAAGAIASAGVDGLVLTSTVTRTKPDWKIAATHRDGVASMALGRVTVPTLIMSHRKDGCDVTPSSDAAKLKDRLVKARKVEVVLLDGGSPPVSDPCEAKAQHGFLGIERQAVDTIVSFIKANPK